MALESLMFNESLTDTMLAPFTAMALTLGIAVFVVLGIAVYTYTALTLMTIAKKLGHKYAWLAWIPFASMALVLQLGNFHWAWVFLILIPIAGPVALGLQLWF